MSNTFCFEGKPSKEFPEIEEIITVFYENIELNRKKTSCLWYRNFTAD